MAITTATTILLTSPLIAASSSAPAVVPSAAAEQPQQQELLLSFKASLKDPSGALSTWSPSTPYCNWSHVTCTGGGGGDAVAVGLSFQGLGLSGDVAAELLCRVPGLVTLSLASNIFNQTVPLQLSRCASLVSLNLSSAAFWGPLPDQLTMLASLTTLDLSGNDIEGQVPPGLAALGELEVLDLGGNRLSGVLHPALFRNFTRLHFLDLSKNQFLESELPPELGEMGGLRWLFLQGSGFSGTIPETLLQLEQLEVLDLSMNSLTGALPSAFGHNFRKLLSLDLSQNGFSGPLPASLGGLPVLMYIDVSSNGLIGAIPAELQNLKLTLLNVSYNHLTGRVPPSLVSGALPAVFLEGNPGLCGPGLPNDCDAPLRKHQGLALAATVASFVTGVMLLALGALAVCRRLHGNISSSKTKLVLFYPIKITEDELLAALRDKNDIGRGAFFT